MPPPQHAPQRRFSRLRATALATAVVLSAALPLTAAGAGPLGGPDGQRTGAVAAGVESIDGRPAGGPLTGPLKPRTPDQDRQAPQSDDAQPDDAQSDDAQSDDAQSDDAQSGRTRSDDAALAAAQPRAERTGPGPSADCGPLIDVRDRATAQTCVLEEEDLTWGRTYYRNTSGTPLMGVLTLLRPDGRTLQVHCELPPSGNPATCETPRERTVHPLEHEEPYMAVAEIATADSERMLLRAGSNPAQNQAS